MQDHDGYVIDSHHHGQAEPEPKFTASNTDLALDQLKKQMQALEDSKEDIRAPQEGNRHRKGKVKLPFQVYQERCAKRIA